MARRKARELAFQTLFQAERGHLSVNEVWQQARESLAEQVEDEDTYGERLDSEDIAFAGRLLTAFDAHRELVDQRLREAIEGWDFKQMAQTDLNILRLALTEFLYEPDVAREVAIEMAVRLAKKFGGEDSGRFVNGVLAKLYRTAAPAP
jgi:N utilization substance protein B